MAHVKKRKKKRKKQPKTWKAKKNQECQLVRKYLEESWETKKKEYTKSMESKINIKGNTHSR